MFARSRPIDAHGSEAIAETVRWIETTALDGERYRYARGCPATLLATCFAVLGLELLGELSSMPAARRRTLTAGIASCQDARTGLFRDPLHDDAELYKLRKFTPLYVRWQETYFALHALDALAAAGASETPFRPPAALDFFEPFRDRRTLDTWLDGLGFDDFWFSSNYVMFLLFFALVCEGEQSPTAHRVLDYLDARQDPETGFWGTAQGASRFNGMAGAFHVYGFYRHLRRPIAYEDAAIRATLALQEKSGLFGDAGGGACEDVDAIDILVKLRPGSPAQAREVSVALERALAGLARCRRPDGGYSWKSADAGAHHEITYSGLERLRARSDESDVWSAWFRPLGIALAAEHLGSLGRWRPVFRRLPLLGFHRPGGRR
jgi:hypothetical protein